MDSTTSRYPKATQQAQRVAQHIRSLYEQTSPTTEIAIVSDTSFAVAHSYITATGRKGPIQVVGVPPNVVCPGMQIYVRRMTQKGLNFYVFDGVAPATLNFGTTSGCIVSTTGANPVAASTNSYGNGSVGTGSSLVTVPASPPTNGWFWSFFFYMSALPSAAAPCVLLDMPLVNTSWVITGGFRITYNYLGQLNAYFYNWPSTTISASTQQVFAPHHVWFATFSIGNGLAVNGAQYSNMTIAPLTGGLTVKAGTYGMFLLSDSNGANAAPAGSWLSKITFGCNNNASTGFWPYPLNGFIPAKDSDIVTGANALGSGLTVYDRWLCSDGSSSSLPDTGTANVPLYNLSTLLSTGPY